MNDENLLTVKGLRRREVRVRPPFYPAVKKEGAVYKVSVESGYVVERVMAGDTALVYHLPTGVVDGAGDPVWHTITSGQCVYVQVAVDVDGTITTDPLVLIEADELAGEHYRPEVFDFGGNAGTHNYKICKFEIVDGKPKLKLFGAGDNIDHYEERVSMMNMDAEGTVYEVGKDYDEATDKVRLRKLKQLTGGGGVEIVKEQLEASINFRNIKQKDSPTRIQVTEEEDSILIQGNSNSGTLTHIPCDEEAGTVILEWDDGLIISSSASFTAGCSTTASGGGGGMP